MEIKNTYIFGEFISKDFWTVNEIKDIGLKAQAIRKEIFSVPKDYIVNVLDKTGKLFLDKNSVYYKSALKHLEEKITFSREMIIETLNIIPIILNKSELSKRMNLEMFFPYALDVPMERHGYDGFLRAFPKGVVLHIGAGNVFLGILDSLILGMVTKNVNIVKLSTSGSNFLNIFAMALREVDDKKVLSNSFSILSWPGGKKELEEEILKHVNNVFVWGGEEAVLSYRKIAPLTVKVEAFGPKTSFGIVFESAINQEGMDLIAEKTAKDCGMWDQSACSNMHTLYFVAPKEKHKSIIKKYFKSANKYFNDFHKKFPQGKLTEDEKVEITRTRELAKVDKALGQAEYISSFPETHWTIIWEKKPFYRISPLNRVLYLKTVENIDEIRKEIIPFCGYLQTVGVAGNIIERKRVLESFFDLQIARIVEIGKMLEGKTGSPHDGIFPMMQLVHWTAMEGKSSNEDKLIEIVKLAREKSVFYKKHYSKCKEVLSISDFQKLPFLEKKHILENTPPESEDLLTDKPKRGIYFASGGSTGQPKYVFYDQHEYERTTRMLAYAYEAAGLKEGDIIANLFVAGNLWSSWLSVEKAIAYTKAISVPTGSNLPLENIVKYLKEFRVNSLIGLPSFLVKLAEYIDENKISLPIKTIFYGGEYVGDEMISFFEKIFPQVQVKSAGYATADAGVIGFQCEKLSKGCHHLFAYSQYIEFIDTNTGLPVKDEEIGELVVTSLNKKHMPIIRYRVGDLGRWIKKECLCGRKEPVFEILGRCDDRIHVGGAHLFVNDIQNAIGKIKELSFNFQVIVEKRGHKDNLKILIEIKSEKYLAEKDKIIERFYEQLYTHCEDLKESVRMKWIAPPEIEILPPDKIERVKRTGKIKKVIDKRLKI